MIDGVKIIPLKQIVDERGKIMHMMKATDPHFIRFGEIYFSCAWPGTVKAWHVHKSMTINNAVVSGRAKLVMYDLREQSPTRGELQEVFFGEDNYCLVQMPPGIANGYKAFGDPPRPRWGDYGAAAVDGGDIWFASEWIAADCTLAQYMAGAFGSCGGTRTSLANWATRISKVTP